MIFQILIARKLCDIGWLYLLLEISLSIITACQSATGKKITLLLNIIQLQARLNSLFKCSSFSIHEDICIFYSKNLTVSWTNKSFFISDSYHLYSYSHKSSIFNEKRSIRHSVNRLSWLKWDDFRLFSHGFISYPISVLTQRRYSRYKDYI